MNVLRFISIFGLIVVFFNSCMAISWPWTPKYYAKNSLTEYLHINPQWKIIIHRFEKAPGKRRYDLRKISCIEVRTTDPESMVEEVFINFHSDTLFLIARNPSTEFTTLFKRKEIGFVSINPALKTEITFHSHVYKGVQFLEFFRSQLPKEVYDKLLTLLSKVNG
jgi:hypothetical protein